MLVSLPYCDPTGKSNATLNRQLPALFSTFEKVCLSVVPPTAESNATSVDCLKSKNVQLTFQERGTLQGQNSRAALALVLEQACPADRICFGFLHRNLFALEIEFCTEFLADLRRQSERHCVVFERSHEAWGTPRENYGEIEHMASRKYQFMYGEWIDSMPCAFLISRHVAELLRSQSTAIGTEAGAEWALLATMHRIHIDRPQVDWLA